MCVYCDKNTFTEWNEGEVQLHLRTTVNDDILFKKVNVTSLIDIFLSYTKNLGITTQELEQAYYEKNEENYRRLREGY